MYLVFIKDVTFPAFEYDGQCFCLLILFQCSVFLT